MLKCEQKLAVKLLKELDRRFVSDGTGDLLLPDNPKNRKMVERAQAWSAGKSVAKYKNDPNRIRVLREGGQIYSNDAVMCAYIRMRIGGKKVG